MTGQLQSRGQVNNTVNSEWPALSIYRRMGRSNTGLLATGFSHFAAVLAAVTLCACGAVPTSSPRLVDNSLEFDTSAFGPRPQMVTPAELFELRDVQQRDFLAYFNDPANQITPAHERIYNYLFTTTADFDFHSDTRTAIETLDSAAGNCLSLAILTTALAQLVDVDTGYQLVDSTPVFERRGGVISKGVHVRSILYDPRWEIVKGETARRRPGIRFDYFADDTEQTRLVGNLPYEAYVAMYYSNVAGEAMVRGDLGGAFWYSLEALEQDPRNAIALNTLAVVHRRAGDVQTAERLYRRGVERFPKNATLLRNYHRILKSQNRQREARSVMRALAKLDDQNPFNWVNAGRDALADGEYQESLRYFRQALEIAPYLHEAYALMAVAHLKMGDAERGKRKLQQALDNAQRRRARSLYQAKLSMLGN